MLGTDPDTYVLPAQPPWGKGATSPHFKDEKTNAQTGQGMYPHPHASSIWTSSGPGSLAPGPLLLHCTLLCFPKRTVLPKTCLFKID